MNMPHLLRWRNYHLFMKNRIIVTIIIFVILALYNIEQISAQNNRPDPLILNLDENSGVKGKIYYTKTFNELSFYYRNITLEVIAGNLVNEINGAIVNIPNKKIKLLNTSGSRSTPSMNEFNFVANPVQLNGIQTIIGGYKGGFTNYSRGDTWTFEFEVEMEGGENLKNVPSGRYSMDLTFRLAIGFGWFLSDSYESRSNLIINYNKLELANEIVINAQQISLALASVDDYTGGISKTYNNGISVTYNTGYKVNVHTTNEVFNNSTIPVKVVGMKIDGSPAFGSSRGIKPLSTNSTTLFQGVGTGGKTRNLDVHYYITAENAKKLLTYDPKEYETTLIYTLSPQ